MNKFLRALTVLIIFFAANAPAHAADLDKAYKKQILKDAGLPAADLKALTPVVGPAELAKIIKKYDESAANYTVDKEGVLKANLHLHTIYSDGTLNVEQVLNQALNESFARRPVIIAFTDHNNIGQDKEIIDILIKDPEKYKSLKIILGIEIYTLGTNFKNTHTPVDIHMLAWVINPYDKVLEEAFTVAQKDPNNPNNWQYRTFEDAIKLINNQQYGFIGIAHPMRELEKSMAPENFNDFIAEEFALYSTLSKKDVKFAEVYYKPGRLYDEHNAFHKFINEIAVKNNITRTGSYDTHGLSIFAP